MPKPYACIYIYYCENRFFQIILYREMSDQFSKKKVIYFTICPTRFCLFRMLLCTSEWLKHVRSPVES